MNTPLKELNELQNFTESILLIKQHREKHKEVFEELEQLQEMADENEEQLKIWARENGNVDNGIVQVKVMEKWHKYYLPEKVKEDERAYQLLKDGGAIKEEINKTIADKIAKEYKEILPTLQASFAEEQMTSSVIIKIQI